MSTPKSITLEGWHEGAHKIRATKAVRKAGGLDLASGKKVIDWCISGRPASFEVQAGIDAAEAAQELARLGFVARVGDRVYRPAKGEPGSSFWDRQIGVFVPSEFRSVPEAGACEVAGILKRGRVRKGDQLAIPLHERFLVVATVLEVSEAEDLLTLRLASEGEEDEEFWREMSVIGDRLPILPVSQPAA